MIKECAQKNVLKSLTKTKIESKGAFLKLECIIKTWALFVFFLSGLVLRFTNHEKFDPSFLGLVSEIVAIINFLPNTQAMNSIE